MKSTLLAIVLCLSASLYSQQPEKAAGIRLQYVLLNDASRFTQWPKGTQQQANMAVQVLKQVVTPGSDAGSLANFGDDLEVSLGIVNSNNPDEIATTLVRQGKGGTALYSNIVSGAQWLAKQQLSDSRKVVFVFSDGDDDASTISLKDATRTLQTLHIPVFVIAPSMVEHKKQGKAMRQIADATGGHAYFVPDADTFDFATLKHDLGR